MDYIGWLAMPPADQWDLVIKIAYLIGSILAAWWTISRWYIAKKIEIESELLKHIAVTEAHWHTVQQQNTHNLEEADLAMIKCRLEELSEDRKQVIGNTLGLKKLRTLNKAYLSQATFSEKYSELISKPPS